MPCKIKKQIIYFQDVMAQSIYYYFKGKKVGHSEKHWTKVRLKSSRASTKSYSSMSNIKGFRWHWLSCFPACSVHVLSWVGLAAYIQLSLADTPLVWHCQHLGDLYYNPGFTFYQKPSRSFASNFAQGSKRVNTINIGSKSEGYRKRIFSYHMLSIHVLFIVLDCTLF